MQSESVSAGSVSTSTSYRAAAGGDAVKARTDILEDAIELYQSGAVSGARRTVAVFGRRQP
ncbi:MAG: hypothetical protein LBK71_08725 [Verrucomicrobiales bacterium]|nr:hypothetical protein [Verrucomicrobiales bacterium]